MTSTIIPLQGFSNNRLQRLRHLAKIAVEKRLRFSNLDDIGLNMIAIDIVTRKLLFLNYSTGTASCLMVDLNTLQDCTIKTQYNGIHAGALTKRKMSDFLKSIFLNLHFRNGSTPVTLPIYEERKDRLDDIEQLEIKAKKWYNIFSKLLKPPGPETVKHNSIRLPG